MSDARIRRQAALGACAILTVLVGCGKSNTAPSGPVDTTPALGAPCTVAGGTIMCPPVQNTRGLSFSVYANNSGAPIAWTYTFAGISVSGTGDKMSTFTGMTPGELEVSGQILERGGMSFTIIGASSNVPGKPVANSFISLEGPPATPSCAGISYLIPFGGAAPQNFRFKFTLDSTSSQQPPCF